MTACIFIFMILTIIVVSFPDTCSGYWHGNVHVRTRKANDLQDLSVFLDEVATLTRIRHENIQLFMGMCLDMDGGTLAVVTR